ncbi:MAG: DMT family transporter [Holosporaceae bacterium]|jgi:S-adenosylmethionine uptake transporter|nr:DMT family transporter [Holosporaceae bacterium]
MNLNNNGYYRGLFFMMMVMVVSCANDVIAKFMGQRLDALQVIFFRFLFGLITLLPLVLRKGKQVFKSHQLGLNLTRGVLGAISLFLYTYSVIHLPLVEVVTILWTVPLFVLVLSICCLGEEVSHLRWIATLIGFIGLSFISLYDSDTSISFKWVYIIPISSSFLFAVQDVMIKKIVDNENRITMLLYFAIVTSVIAFVPALFVWKTPTPFECSMLFLLGAGGNAIQYFLFKAFSATDLSALAPFRYVEFLFSAFFAFVFFAEVPGANVLIGAAILIPSTLYLAYNEKQQDLRQSA